MLLLHEILIVVVALAWIAYTLALLYPETARRLTSRFTRRGAH